MLTDAQEAILYNHYRNGGYAPPVNVYLALHTGGGPIDLNTGAGFVEPTDSNYDRVRVAQNLLWSTAQTNAAQRVESTSILQIDFPEAAIDYPDKVTHIVELDSPTLALPSNIRRIYQLNYDPADDGVTILQNQKLRLPIGALKTEMGRTTVVGFEVILSDVSVVV